MSALDTIDIDAITFEQLWFVSSARYCLSPSSTSSGISLSPFRSSPPPSSQSELHADWPAIPLASASAVWEVPSNSTSESCPLTCKILVRFHLFISSYIAHTGFFSSSNFFVTSAPPFQLPFGQPNYVFRWWIQPSDFIGILECSIFPACISIRFIDVLWNING